uniref:Uncharacterized protein n=1 Tax=Lygus hesperus TaxID=30085 RepID=A0A0K8T998_LYGHE
MATFKTPKDDPNCSGCLISFFSGITTPMHSIAKRAVPKNCGKPPTAERLPRRQRGQILEHVIDDDSIADDRRCCADGRKRSQVFEISNTIEERQRHPQHEHVPPHIQAVERVLVIVNNCFEVGSHEDNVYGGCTKKSEKEE